MGALISDISFPILLSICLALGLLDIIIDISLNPFFMSEGVRR